MEGIGALFDTLLVNPMIFGLVELAKFTGSAGLAIILFTVFIKGLLLPLSIYQSKSQKAMMVLQPEIKAVQKKYGQDRERMTQETMRLYKEHGINPASGCLPLLLQMPVFYGLFFALQRLGQPEPGGDEAFRQPFLWLTSLAHPDIIPLPIADLPFPGLPGLLPLFMAGSQYVMSKMMQTSTADPQMQSMNRMMTTFMPLMMLFFSYSFPSGLVLYWGVSNVFSVIQQGFITGWGPLVPLVGSLGKASGDTPPPPKQSDVVSNGLVSSVDQNRRSLKAARVSKGKKRGKR